MRNGSARRPFSFLAVLLVTLLVAAACTNGGGAHDQDAAATEASSAEASGEELATSEAATVSASGTGLRNGLAEYDFAAAVTNSYWYSRYTLGNLVMMSGLGVPFMPPMEAVMAMVGMVDQGPADGEHVALPQNPALLRAVFAGGDPQFVNAFNGDPGDLINYRWDPATADTALTPAAQAQTIIKELAWAKFFNLPGWTGGVTADFGAMDRFKGMVMYAGAKAQLAFALEHLRNDEGFFVAGARFDDGVVTVTDATIRPADQYQMLQALADMRWLLQHADRFNAVYGDPETLATIGAAADALFRTIARLDPRGVQDLALGAQAVAWYAASVEDGALQAQALAALRRFGDQLLEAERRGVIDRARATRGLLEVARVLGNDPYRAGALADLTALLDAYQPDLGYFEGATTIADWEVGDILGALNSALVNGGAAVDRPRVQRTYAGFFEAVVNIGGLQRAVVPKEMEASPFELARFPDDLTFAYPGRPFPPAAGGPHGTAAVHAAALRFDEAAGRWRVSDPSFDTAGAMHTSNEIFWTFGLVSGFPTVEALAVANVPPN